MFSRDTCWNSLMPCPSNLMLVSGWLTPVDLPLFFGPSLLTSFTSINEATQEGVLNPQPYHQFHPLMLMQTELLLNLVPRPA